MTDERTLMGGGAGADDRWAPLDLGLLFASALVAVLSALSLAALDDSSALDDILTVIGTVAGLGGVLAACSARQLSRRPSLDALEQEAQEAARDLNWIAELIEDGDLKVRVDELGHEATTTFQNHTTGSDRYESREGRGYPGPALAEASRLVEVLVRHGRYRSAENLEMARHRVESRLPERPDEPER